MKIKGLKLSQDEVSQEFDLNELLGMDVSDDDGLVEAVGQFLIDRIVERTQEGKSSDGSKFAKYSASYKDSLEFKAFEKSSNVNMTLSGDMLSSLTIISSKNGKIKIGWDDPENNAKAYGHMTGMEGHPVLEGITPKRQFFGVTADEIAVMKKEFRPDFSEKAKENDSILVGKIAKLAGLI